MPACVPACVRACVRVCVLVYAAFVSFQLFLCASPVRARLFVVCVCVCVCVFIQSISMSVCIWTVGTISVLLAL